MKHNNITNQRKEIKFNDTLTYLLTYLPNHLRAAGQRIKPSSENAMLVCLVSITLPVPMSICCLLFPSRLISSRSLLVFLSLSRGVHFMTTLGDGVRCIPHTIVQSTAIFRAWMVLFLLYGFSFEMELTVFWEENEQYSAKTSDLEDVCH